METKQTFLKYSVYRMLTNERTIPKYCLEKHFCTALNSGTSKCHLLKSQHMKTSWQKEQLYSVLQHPSGISTCGLLLCIEHTFLNANLVVSCFIGNCTWNSCPTLCCVTEQQVERTSRGHLVQKSTQRRANLDQGAHGLGPIEFSMSSGMEISQLSCTPVPMFACPHSKNFLPNI